MEKNNKTKQSKTKNENQETISILHARPRKRLTSCVLFLSPWRKESGKQAALIWPVKLTNYSTDSVRDIIKHKNNKLTYAFLETDFILELLNCGLKFTLRAIMR